MPAWNCLKDGICSKRTFQGRHHVSEYTKGYAGDSGGVVVTCEDRSCASKEKVTKNWRNEVVWRYSIFTCTVSTLKAAFDTTLESLQKISVLTWEMNFLSDWFSISF